MSKAKFTPGPWRWVKPTGSVALISTGYDGYAHDGTVLAPTTDFEYRRPSLVASQADMTLIAAAPLLYESLEEMLGLVRDLPSPEHSTREQRVQIMRGLRNAELALATARGEIENDR